MAVSPLPLAPVADECRCACGNLLARLVPDGVELKCRRCKRTLVLPLSETLTETPRPEAKSPESEPRASARARRIRWLDPCDEVS
jgi:phage FluMu protein Com